MSKKIIGVTVGTPLPKPNLMQTDPTKGDYVKGKEQFLAQIDTYTKNEIDAIMGSYITDIDTLVGGDS